MASDVEIEKAQEQFGLGAIPYVDVRDKEYPIAAAMPSGLVYPERSYTWTCPTCLNQLTTGTCVGHGVRHELIARPQNWPSSPVVKGQLDYLAILLYLAFCKEDPWPQNDAGDLNFGTDLNTAMKVMVKMGFYGEYRHAFAQPELLLARGYQGPVLLAVPWFNSMFFPNAKGEIEVKESSGLAGWHCLLTNGQSITTKKGRWHNSWGTEWGINGEGFVSFSDEEKLITYPGATATIPMRRTTV